MSDRLAEIVCVRPDGRDPRTVSEMGKVAEQIKKLPTLKEWEGKAIRPILKLRDDAGAELDAKTGEPIPRPPKPKKAAAADAPATDPQP